MYTKMSGYKLPGKHAAKLDIAELYGAKNLDQY